jgi:hypothetical protein
MTMYHKHGGKILKITAIEHETYRRVANWWFIGDVQWSDAGRTQIGARIFPDQVQYDASDNGTGRIEVLAVMEKLSDYLHNYGEWTARGKWVPTAKKGKVLLDDFLEQTPQPSLAEG